MRFYEGSIWVDCGVAHQIPHLVIARKNRCDARHCEMIAADGRIAAPSN